jgi:hypothetical protein
MRREAGPVKVRAQQAPQHHAPIPALPPVHGGGRDPRSGRVGASPEASENVSGKGGGERAILLVAAYPQDLVQGAPREPAAVNRSDTKGQYSMCHRPRPLDPSDALT